MRFFYKLNPLFFHTNNYIFSPKTPVFSSEEAGYEQNMTYNDIYLTYIDI